MGSPLAPILANLFMGYHEEQWIGNYKDSQLLYYRRYVDDTFCLFHNEQDAMKFLSYLNSRHPNIRFTFETQLNEKLSFLDVLVDTSEASCITSISHKSTYTGLVTNFLSFTFTFSLTLLPLSHPPHPPPPTGTFRGSKSNVITGKGFHSVNGYGKGQNKFNEKELLNSYMVRTKIETFFSRTFQGLIKDQIYFLRTLHAMPCYLFNKLNHSVRTKLAIIYG